MTYISNKVNIWATNEPKAEAPVFSSNMSYFCLLSDLNNVKEREFHFISVTEIWLWVQKRYHLLFMLSVYECVKCVKKVDERDDG